MNVGQLIELLRAYPDYREVRVDGAWATEVSEESHPRVDEPVVMIR